MRSLSNEEFIKIKVESAKALRKLLAACKATTAREKFEFCKEHNILVEDAEWDPDRHNCEANVIADCLRLFEVDTNETMETAAAEQHHIGKELNVVDLSNTLKCMNSVNYTAQMTTTVSRFLHCLERMGHDAFDNDFTAAKAFEMWSDLSVHREALLQRYGLLRSVSDPTDLFVILLISWKSLPDRLLWVRVQQVLWRRHRQLPHPASRLPLLLERGVRGQHGDDRQEDGR